MRSSFWKSNGFIALLVTLAIFLAGGSQWMASLEWTLYDMGVKASASKGNDDNVVVVAIDENSIETLGPWPWSRGRLARVVRQLANAKASVIGLTLPLHEAQNALGIDYLNSLQKSYKGEAAGTVKGVLKKAEAALNTDASLAASLNKSAHSVLMVEAYEGQILGSDSVFDERLPALARANASLENQAWTRYIPSVLTRQNHRFDQFALPAGTLLKAAGGAGVLMQSLRTGESMRSIPAFVQLGKHAVPSFPLLVTAHNLGLGKDDIVVHDGLGVQVDSHLYNTDAALRIYPRFYTGPESGQPFTVVSFVDVYQRKVANSSFRDKLVLIGFTAPGLAPLVSTPLEANIPQVMATAHMVSSLANNDVYKVPGWSLPAQLIAIVFIGLYLMLVLPRLRQATGITLSLLLAFVLITAHFGLMMAQGVWVPLAVPLVALIAGMGLFAARRFWDEKLRGVHTELDQAIRTQGELYQAQNKLDTAFDKYRRCVLDDQLVERLYSLGMDFERKRQFNKAAAVFQYVSDGYGEYRDVAERLKRNQDVENAVALGKGTANTAGGTMIMSADGLQNPMLGRYEIEREIGRGAMGLVYYGKDPKIGRTVAIKTMALSQEFEDTQLEDVKKRFFREAETAGRLNHPNIVTIYDVGEEQDLAYIAMDYLKGNNLAHYCKPDNLLPDNKVFDIIIQVAEALDYAHKQNIVHRDIKPANIIYDEKSGEVKVTDFGVACLTDTSKTRTGTVLGSPSYMSPEQLAGNRVDGRSDLFSLGVTFFQLITGELPFVADSLASLMYKIANDKHVDARMLRPDLPTCVSTIINRALYKDIEKRTQSGEQFAKAMRRCKEKLPKTR